VAKRSVEHVKELGTRTPVAAVPAENEDLAGLIARLGADVVTLVESKAGLVTIELKEELAGYTKTLVRLGMATAAALVGLVLLNVALAFLASAFFRPMNVGPTVQYALGFALVGLPYLAAGALAVGRYQRRLGETAYQVREDCGTPAPSRPAVAGTR
jgi:uncharacterized membrane protein YqjE